MTTMTRLPWDHFVPEGEPKNHIKRFREVEWPRIFRSLSDQYGWKMDETEPHWVAPARAVYWHEDLIRTTSRDATGKLVITFVSQGWHPTAGLPAGNANVINYYLRKGFRFRPPTDEVEAEYVEAAASAEVPQPDEERVFVCDRHEKGMIQFRTWSSYLVHCDRYQETPNEEPPDAVVERMNDFPYYCVVHDVGFTSTKLAQRHIRSSVRKPGARRTHLSVEQMRVGTS